MEAVGKDASPEFKASLLEMVLLLTRALDLVDPAAGRHNLEVSYIALNICRELGVPPDMELEIALAGAVHDVGALSLEEKREISLPEFEDPHRHAERGYRMLGRFKPFSAISRIVRYHHVRWEEAQESAGDDREVPLGSQVLHVADRAAMFLDRSREIISQVRRVLDMVKEQSRSRFHPEVVEAFVSASRREHFWFDVVSPYLETTLSEMLEAQAGLLGRDELLDLAGCYSHIIDFRSPFTSTHSSGVAAAAVALARIAGFKEEDLELIKVAGELHDIGKLAVPTEILEKPGKLSADEWNIVLTHPYYSYRILKPVTAMVTVNDWGSLHHERVDGSGYPFHFAGDALSEGSRLTAVADVYTALSEDRPYRSGMAPGEVAEALRQMSRARKLDSGPVRTLLENLDVVAAARRSAQADARETYREVMDPGERTIS